MFELQWRFLFVILCTLLKGISCSENRLLIKDFAHQLEADGKPFPAEETPPARALRGEMVQNMAMVLHRPDGKTLWTLVSAAPIRTPRTLPDSSF